MTQEGTKENSEKVAAGEALPPQFVERRWPLKDVAREEADFALPLLASELRHARTLLTKLAGTSFGWTEIWLAGASLLIGAVFGVLPSDLKLENKLIPILFYCVFPALGATMFVGYVLAKRHENATTRETAARLLDSLPDIPVIAPVEATNEIKISLKVDSAGFSGDLTPPEMKEAAGRLSEAVSGELDFSRMSDSDLLYRFAAALFEEKMDQAEAIDNFQRGREEFLQPKFAARWQADVLYWKLISNNGGDFEQLKALASGLHPDSYICNNVAAVYRWNREYELAAEWLKKAATNAETLRDKIDFLSRAVERLYEADKVEAAIALYEEIGQMPGDDEAALKARTVGAAEFFELQKQLDIEVAVLEYRLHQDPTNYDSRFSLAYKYGQLGKRSLSAYHYTLIPSGNRNAVAWNNLGVTWSALELPGSAAEAYQKSYDLGETLATSNLANLMIDAGFFVQARKMIARDLKQDHNVQLDRTVVKLEDAQEKDEKKREELLVNARQQAVFYRKLGQQAIAPPPSRREGVFSDDEYVLTLHFHGSNVVGTATQSTTENKLAVSLLGKAEGIVVQELSVSGRCFGAAISLELRRQEGGKIVSLFATPIKFLGFFVADGLECIQTTEGDKWTSHKFGRQPSAEVVASAIEG